MGLNKENETLNSTDRDALQMVSGSTKQYTICLKRVDKRRIPLAVAPKSKIDRATSYSFYFVEGFNKFLKVENNSTEKVGQSIPRP
jgi:hypothetical protein